MRWDWGEGAWETGGFTIMMRTKKRSGEKIPSCQFFGEDIEYDKAWPAEAEEWPEAPGPLFLCPK